MDLSCKKATGLSRGPVWPLRRREDTILRMPEPTDAVTQALREGRIPLGTATLRLGSTIRDAAEALGLDPERPAYRWREVGGADGLRWNVACGFLWSPPPPTMVELVFHDDALTSVQGADASWE